MSRSGVSKPRMGRPSLVDREAIVNAAVEIGFDRLTMSAVGSLLGVRHSTLYRYFATRDALAAAAIDRCVDSVPWPEPEGDWREFLRATARSYWSLYERHAGLAVEVSALRTISAALVDIANRSGVVLLDLGFDAEDAVLVIDMLGELVTQAFLGAAAASPQAPATTEEPDDVGVVDGSRRRREQLLRPWLDHYDVRLRDVLAEVIARPPVEQFEKKLEIFLDGVGRRAGDR
ncbi:TetR/AcrR family transcriptional regulator [Actinophytocola sp.]|uniref:TetR/AcrR family transcriptional regulator n=1 Tax=Actinophytocola sp. TaxID=1872138 RepID=UPI002ED504BE